MQKHTNVLFFSAKAPYKHHLRTVENLTSGAASKYTVHIIQGKQCDIQTRDGSERRRLSVSSCTAPVSYGLIV